MIFILTVFKLFITILLFIYLQNINLKILHQTLEIDYIYVNLNSVKTYILKSLSQELTLLRN